MWLSQAVPAPNPPQLRLVGHWPVAAIPADAGFRPAVAPPQPHRLASAPALDTSVDPFDPRWVLAVRTSERLQGALLPPESREALIRLGRVLGLSAFDANLVIAIVQDQARRGRAPVDCPAAAASQLTMIAPGAAIPSPRRPRRRALQAGLAILALLAIEILIVMLVLHR